MKQLHRIDIVLQSQEVLNAQLVLTISFVLCEV